MRLVECLPKDIIYDVPELITPQYKWLVENFSLSQSVCDLTGNVDFPWMKRLYKLPAGTTNLSYSEIAHNRAKEIIDEGKLVSLYWSGGMDSTAALCALHAGGIPKDQLVIYYTPMSIVEYPKMYLELVSQYRSVEVPLFFDDIDVEDGSLVVTGEGGDQLFGRQVIPPKNILSPITGRYESMYSRNTGMIWRSTYGIRIERTGILDDAPPEILNLVKSAPFELITKHDLYWWLDLTLSWQHMCLRIVAHSPKETFSAFLRDGRPFFDYPDFLRWSMNEYNHRELKQALAPMQRRPQKDLIQSIFPDEAYYRYKSKFGSLPSAYRTNVKGRFEDGTLVTTREELLGKLGPDAGY